MANKRTSLPATSGKPGKSSLKDMLSLPKFLRSPLRGLQHILNDRGKKSPEKKAAEPQQASEASAGVLASQDTLLVLAPLAARPASRYVVDGSTAATRGASSGSYFTAPTTLSWPSSAASSPSPPPSAHPESIQTSARAMPSRSLQDVWTLSRVAGVDTDSHPDVRGGGSNSSGYETAPRPARSALLPVHPRRSASSAPSFHRTARDARDGCSGGGAEGSSRSTRSLLRGSARQAPSSVTGGGSGGGLSAERGRRQRLRPARWPPPPPHSDSATCSSVDGSTSDSSTSSSWHALLRHSDTSFDSSGTVPPKRSISECSAAALESAAERLFGRGSAVAAAALAAAAAAAAAPASSAATAGKRSRSHSLPAPTAATPVADAAAGLIWSNADHTTEGGGSVLGVDDRRDDDDSDDVDDEDEPRSTASRGSLARSPPLRSLRLVRRLATRLVAVGVVGSLYLALYAPPALCGAALGACCMYYFMSWMNWLFNPSVHTVCIPAVTDPGLAIDFASHRRTTFKNVNQAQEEAQHVYRGWLNLLENVDYNPADFNMNSTVAVLARLDGLRLLVQRPQQRVQHCLSPDEPLHDVTVVAQMVLNMTDYSVQLQPRGIRGALIWRKQYPISLRLHGLTPHGRQSSSPDRQRGWTLERGTVDASFQYKRASARDYFSEAPRVLHFFSRSHKEKEEWFKRLNAASKGIAFTSRLDDIVRHVSSRRSEQLPATATPLRGRGLLTRQPLTSPVAAAATSAGNSPSTSQGKSIGRSPAPSESSHGFDSHSVSQWQERNHSSSRLDAGSRLQFGQETIDEYVQYMARTMHYSEAFEPLRSARIVPGQSSLHHLPAGSRPASLGYASPGTPAGPSTCEGPCCHGRGGGAGVETGAREQQEQQQQQLQQQAPQQHLQQPSPPTRRPLLSFRKALAQQQQQQQQQQQAEPPTHGREKATQHSPTAAGVLPTPVTGCWSLQGCDTGVLWLNAMLGRLFFDFFRGDQLKELVRNKVQNKLYKIMLPFCVNQLTLKDLHLGMELPVIRRIGKPYLDDDGLWFDVDIAYGGGLSISVETKINVLQLKQDNMQRVKKDLPVDPDDTHGKDEFAKNAEKGKDEDRTVTSTIAAVASSGSIGSAGSDCSKPDISPIPQPTPQDRMSRFLTRLKNSKYFQQLASTRIISNALENMSNTRLTLTVEVKHLSGLVALNIGTPPTDRIWYGFRRKPRLIITATPMIGDRSVSLSRIVEWIEKKISVEIERTLVVPNMEDVRVPFMQSYVAASHPRSAK